MPKVPLPAPAPDWDDPRFRARDRRTAQVIILIVIVLGLVVVGVVQLNRRSGNGQAAGRRTPGVLFTPGTISTAPFQLPVDRDHTSTTDAAYANGDFATPTVTTVPPTTTTTIPGTGSADAVCAGMANVYAASTLIPAHATPLQLSATAGPFGTSVGALIEAIGYSKASDLAAYKARLLVRLGPIPKLLVQPTQQSFRDVYELASNPSHPPDGPALLGLFAHIRHTCPALATKLGIS